jgi:hypothetical protein
MVWDSYRKSINVNQFGIGSFVLKLSESPKPQVFQNRTGVFSAGWRTQRPAQF